MIPPFCAMAIMASLTGAAIGVFALLILGIRKGDRGHLALAPRSSSETVARRCLVTVRTNDRRN
jgi:hypothetical protein